MNSQKAALALRIIITCALIFLIAKIANFKIIAQHFSNAHMGYLILSWLCLQLIFVLQATRWKSLVNPLSSIKLKFWNYYYYNLQGHFYNLFLPTSIGGDAVKTIALGKKINNTYASFSGVLVNRWMGFIWIVLFFWSFYWLNPQLITENKIPKIIFIFTLIFFVASPILYKKKQLPDNFIGRKLNPLLQHIQSYSKTHLAWNFLFAGVTQFCIFLMEYLAYKSVGLNISLSQILTLVPIVYLITMLPISIGGYGLREGLIILLFTRIPGNTADMCLSGVWMTYIMSVSQAIFAGILILCTKQKPQADLA